MPISNAANSTKCVLPPHLQPLEAWADATYGSAQRLGQNSKNAAAQQCEILGQHEADMEAHLRRHGAQQGALAQPYQVPGSEASCADQAQLQQLLQAVRQKRQEQQKLGEQGGALVDQARQLAAEFWRRIQQLCETAHQTLMGIIRNFQ